MKDPLAAPRVAVLDTDTGFLQVLTKRMDRLGWEHRVFAGAINPDELVAMHAGALVVDLATLGPAAWDELERVCGELPALAVIVCTGGSTVAQRVRGLRLGADDWVTKPCHPEEVLARVEAVLRRGRRSEPASAADAVVAGDLEIRPDHFQAYVDGASVELTRREFELIQLLSAAEGRVLEREEIYERVWGYAMARGDRSVDVFVRKLRQKLDKASPGWRYIHTHFGVGYRFGAERSDGQEGAAAPAPAAEPESDPARHTSGAPAGTRRRAASLV